MEPWMLSGPDDDPPCVPSADSFIFIPFFPITSAYPSDFLRVTVILHLEPVLEESLQHLLQFGELSNLVHGQKRA